MPTIVPYCLTFNNGLHIGTRGVNLEEIGLSVPSDTLFAALVDAWRRRGGDVDGFVRPFISQPPDPPFLLSSAFPFAGEVLFFPMPPDLTALFMPETIIQRGKDLKRIRYLSQGLLQKRLGGSLLDEDLFPEQETSEPTTGVALQDGSLWFSLDEHDKLPDELRRAPNKRHALRNLRVWSSGHVPRVTISRITSASNLFHAGRVQFAQECGLWFAVQWRHPETFLAPDQTYEQAFTHTLAILQDDGLGGERTAGYGAFNYKQMGQLQFAPEPNPGEPSYLISRYHPAEDELPQALTGHQRNAYQLVSVAGWLRSPDGAAQRRKRVFLVAEGSLVSPARLPPGDVCDVRPTYDEKVGGLPHPVYRYGLGLSIAWNLAPGRS